MSKIKNVYARQILDSRGNPTVEAELSLECGITTFASVPSGASTGKYEAHELRDTTDKSYGGKGVLNAAANINGEIAEVLKGKQADAQYDIDRTLIELDGTESKHRLGANAILAVSLAVARAGALLHGEELYEYIGGISGTVMPIPMMNILNGGAHASNNIDIQEFMVVPWGTASYSEALKAGCAVYRALKELLRSKGLSLTVGDEGGFAPDFESDSSALELITDAIDKSGYKAGRDISIGLDIASSAWFKNGSYSPPKRGGIMTRQQLLSYYTKLCENYPLISIEDPFSEDDFEGFTMITSALGKERLIIGDDLFVTNTARLKKGISQNAGNAILIKPNQTGTLSETIAAVRLARANGFRTVISHRSGETEDTAVADIAIGLNAGYIKIGAPARGERTAKYNRLLRIEERLSKSALFKSAAASRAPCHKSD